MVSPPTITLLAALLAAPDPGAYARAARASAGDPARGRAIFADTKGAGCIACHKVKGEGGSVGPDLSEIGGKYDRAHIVESILDPSRQVVEGYGLTAVATVDGRVLTGVVRGESADGLTLVDPEGNGHPIRNAEIEGRKLTGASPMPDGLVERITPGEFADLVAYLEGLRPAGGAGGKFGLPAGFVARRVAEGITGATAMDVAPDGRVFVCEQTGALRVVKGDALLSTPFATFRVDDQWERGLIGVAVAPDFASSRRIYVCYVAPDPYPHHRISRLTAEGDVAAAGSEAVLFEGDDQRTLGGDVPAGHQGGAIHFGADGKLYAAIGDQTAGKPAQGMDTLQGKLLRLNPDGSIPADNPFYRTARGKYRVIWALGLRNPFTFAVQPGTGRILLNDVGGVAEEVDEGFAGANYGWPTVEHGPTADPRFRGPVHHYPTASIAGGAFCPADSPFPRESRGRYFFMDFVQGWIKVLDPDHPAEAARFAEGLPRPVDLKFAPDGALYVLSRDAWVRDRDFRPGTGVLDRIDPPPARRAP